MAWVIMTTATTQSGVYERGSLTLKFGEFELCVATRELLRAGDPIHMEPKVFDLLVLLVLNDSRVVTKTELFSSLWPCGAISPGVLRNSSKRSLNSMIPPALRPSR